MRKIGIYYAFWTNDWDVDFIQFIPKVKKLGFDILEINGGTIVSWTEFARQNLVNQARLDGLPRTNSKKHTARIKQTIITIPADTPLDVFNITDLFVFIILILY